MLFCVTSVTSSSADYCVCVHVIQSSLYMRGVADTVTPGIIQHVITVLVTSGKRAEVTLSVVSSQPTRLMYCLNVSLLGACTKFQRKIQHCV
jgi:hypothetical protein